MRFGLTSKIASSFGLISIVVVVGCGSSGSGGSGSGQGDGGANGQGGSAQGAGGGPGTGDCTTMDPIHTGEATYYNEADGTGNCSFDATPNDLMIGAMNTPDYAGSAACGACVKLTGPNGEITIRIVDRCPGCPQGNIDLSPVAFAKIADLSAGKVPISWAYAPCAVNGPIRYHWKEGSNQWWTAVQIRNHRSAIKNVAYKLADGTFKDLPRFDYNYFIDESGMGPGPYTMRVTDVYGQTVEDTGVAFVEAGDSEGAAQLPACVIQ